MTPHPNNQPEESGDFEKWINSKDAQKYSGEFIACTGPGKVISHAQSDDGLMDLIADYPNKSELIIDRVPSEPTSNPEGSPEPEVFRWLCKCSVCGMHYVNHVGSTPCCGGIAYVIYDAIKGISRAPDGKPSAEERELETMRKELDEVRAERDRLHALVNAPELIDFQKAVVLEAAHQRERWGSEHDAGKTEADWFWLVGYVAGKALSKPEKRLHHIITTAAVCANWHAAALGKTNMRPGISAEKQSAIES